MQYQQDSDNSTGGDGLSSAPEQPSASAEDQNQQHGHSSPISPEGQQGSLVSNSQVSPRDHIPAAHHSDEEEEDKPEDALPPYDPDIKVEIRPEPLYPELDEILSDPNTKYRPTDRQKREL